MSSRPTSTRPSRSRSPSAAGWARSWSAPAPSPKDVLLLRLAELLDAVYLRNAEDLPDSLEMYRSLSESPIKLEWFLDHAVLMWSRGEELFCLARDIQDHALPEALNYFFRGGR